MRCPILKELPAPPEGKIGWPWTQESAQLPDVASNGKPWPKISIVTPSRNQGEFIEETIRSVLLQGYPNLEYIIMDGGSSDNSIDCIKRYERWLTYWKSEPDGGHADALSKSFSQAGEDMLAFLNSDDIYYPNCLFNVASVFQKIKNKIIFGEGMWIDEKSTKITKYPSFYPSKYAFGCYCTLCQPTVFIPRQIYNEVGGFNTELNYAFDFEYWLRCLDRRVKFYFVRKLLAGSRIHKKCNTMRMQEVINKECSFIKEKYLHFTKVDYFLRKIYNPILLRYIDRQHKELWAVIKESG
jgi:glycosyltransferase involved in cell wall biosynthesis